MLPASAPALSWDYGTAYELFISLHVMHSPESYGLRAAWAAGIRSRIPHTERKFLEEVIPFLGFPLSWVYKLPQPKDALSALYALRQIPPEKRLVSLIDLENWKDEKYKSVFSGTLERGKWTRDELLVLKEAMKEKHDIDEKVVTSFF